MDPYSIVVPGKLKFKRKQGPEKTIKKKKSKRIKKVATAEEDGHVENIIIPEDPRTEMEKKVEEALKAREEKLIKKLASKSYRQRTEELNQSLNELTEHFDIPKVG